MSKNNSLIFIKVFLLSILIASPFLIKQIPFVKEKLESDKKDYSLEEPEEPIISSNDNSNSNSDPSNSNENPPIQEPEEKELSFETVSNNYFDDALFIGDSRTVGIQKYGDLKNATYFCDTGMSVYNIHSKKLSVSGVGKVTLKELLQKKKYGKVYIMLGINEIGNNMDKSAKKFKEVVELVREKQPEAIIFIQANLHVTKAKSEKGPTFNNRRIDKYNGKLAALADNKDIFYFDANGLFDDSGGNLRKDYTFDNTHIYAKYYVNWTKYIREHGIVKSNPNEEKAV